MQQVSTAHCGDAELVGRDAERPTGLHRHPVGGAKAQRGAKDLGRPIVRRRPRLEPTVSLECADKRSRPSEGRVYRDLSATVSEGEQLVVVATGDQLGP
jgi:hypothetical protein